MRIYGFRPWVTRAGLSIVIVAAAASAAILVALIAKPELRYGWIGERFVWVYLGTLWIGGLKVWLGAMRPVAECDEERITLRPLHNLRSRTIRWDSISGTEQMTGGDRLIVYYDTPKGMRFVAINLNLIKGRRDFLIMLEARLQVMGFRERIKDRSRFLTRPSP